ncbi:MAG: mechanosensitive ion channel family protein [Oscillospiraceae bacterium]|nr:mechanosensitive ion channel family protein [Oscillospiraceae bacterium]
MEDFFSKLGATSATSLLSALLLTLICWIVIKIVMKAIDGILARSKKVDGALKNLVRNAVSILLWIVAIILIANALGIDTASLVALLSVAGLALSLAVQNVMSNLFSGITLLITKPFAAGDFVEAAGKMGTVKSVGLFYTQLDTLDNVAVSIPNSDVTASSINNYSREPLRRVDQYFCAAYDADTEAVKAAILEAIGEDERILTDPAPFVRLFAYEASSIKYVSRVWCKNADYWDVYFGLNERVREAFKRHGVAMSYEHVNVHIVEK